jgi:hypothetical protein
MTLGTKTNSICPHCGNDDSTLLEKVGVVKVPAVKISGGGHNRVEEYFEKLKDLLVCQVCSKSFTA